MSKDANKFIAGDCLDLHFDDNQFDLLTISFGLRNLEDRELGFKEAYRVLKPNGRLIVLEFSQPYSWFRPFYYFYLIAVLPWMARLITGDRNAYIWNEVFPLFRIEANWLRSLLQLAFLKLFIVP